MTTTQKVLLCVVLLFAGTAAVGVLGIRALVGGGFGDEAFADTNSAFSTAYPAADELADFDSLLVRGAWDLRIEQGDEWQVALSVPQERQELIDITVEDGRLILGAERRTGPWWTRGNMQKNRAIITLPVLSGIRVEGAGQFIIDEFEGDSLDIDIAGAANVQSGPGRYEDVSITVNGAGNVDLENLTATNVDVALSGAYRVTLDMAGGELSGHMSGVGRLRYDGDVSGENIRVSGMSKLDRPDAR